MAAGLIKPCAMGTGCELYGVCYASAHGRPELCPEQEYDWADDARKSYDLAIRLKRERGDDYFTKEK